MKEYTIEEFAEEGEWIFGKNDAEWLFQCPDCNRIQRINDHVQALASGFNRGDIYRKCLACGHEADENSPISINGIHAFDFYRAEKKEYVRLPKDLTAENGVKFLLLGEFFEENFIACPTCGGDDAECEQCGGRGEILNKVPISWDTIKKIYNTIVDCFERRIIEQG